MLRNYFKSACRILLKNKSFSIINILGLAIGMAASLLIFQYVAFEFSYDQFHEKAENIYRIQHDRYVDGKLQYQKAQSFISLGKTMTLEYPEVIDYTTLFKISDQSDIIITSVSDNGKKLMFPEEQVYHVKGNFFNIFNFSIVEGDINMVSVGKGEVLIAQSIAKKYFGDKPAINQSLNHPYFGDFKVVGVFEDVPDNSHIQFNFLFGWESVTSERRGGDANNWHWDGFYNYIRLSEGTDVPYLESKFPSLVDKYMGNRQNPNLDPVFSLQPLTSIHLHSNLLGEAGKNGNIRSVSILFILGFFILLIAWANYVNLSTAKVMDRAKEAGIRKCLGSTKGDLVKQFLFESLWMNFLALLLALSFTQLIASVYFEINGQAIPYNQPGLWVFSASYLVLIILGSLLSAIYPTAILSSLHPSSILKGNTAIISKKGNTGYLKKAMVVFQFTISMGLIAGATAIFRQVSFMQEKELGINIDQTLVIRTLDVSGPPGSDSLFNKRLDILKDRLSSYPTIEGFAASADIPGKEHLIAIPDIRNMNKKDQWANIYYSRVDVNFMQLFNARLVAGRYFSPRPSSKGRNVIINMEGLKALGLSSPGEAIGAKIYRGNNREGGHEIIGVVDFRATSFKEQNYPIAYQTFFGPVKYLSVKMNFTGTDQLEENIGLIQENWKNVFPDTPFDYFFPDEMFDRQYKSERQFSNLLNMFTGLSIFIACLGLYGLSLFTVRQKTKEIGIRKALGASIRSLVRLLTKDLMVLIFIAGLIAMPLVWILLDLWLKDYPYRTEIPWWIFMVPIFCVTIVAIFTISRQVFKAAFTNPVESLKDE